ncbi:hypothetical protein L6452_24664 [Arctium lappa]|uniref:Uncharacterized protein n=1 Tax=Arctium lappa TaxID=4217 RepID=A0ACB9A9Q9_ARCLA|nr:hypothetical protein L6452_24664 [Arctium lappa]
MDSSTHQKSTNANPNQKKRNASHALVSDQDHVNRNQELLQYVSPAKRYRQISLGANNDNTGGLGSSSECHAATPVVKTEIIGLVKETFASLESLAVGFRFIPTDKELVTHYLLRKIKNQDLPNKNVRDVDIYEDHPENIVENHPQATEEQWLFFSPRNRKYTNGSRPDRKAGNGYWKATGPDKEITNDDGIKIGDKKSLVYHEGHPPKGIKTDWVMHEYVVAGHQRPRLDKSDMKLDDCVLCKIYKKEKRGRRQANNINQVVSDQQQQQSNIQDKNPTTGDHGENNVQVIYDSTNQDHHANRLEGVRVPIPDQEPRSKQAVLLPMSVVSIQEPNPRNFQFKNKGVVQNSFGYCCHSSMGLHNSLSNYDMRFAQPVAPPPVPPPPYHPFCSGPNYMINVPHEILDFNWPVPSHINQQSLQVAGPPADGGGDGSDQFMEFSELVFSEDDLNNYDYDLGFDELGQLNSSEQLIVPKHENKTNEDRS